MALDEGGQFEGRWEEISRIALSLFSLHLALIPVKSVGKLDWEPDGPGAGLCYACAFVALLSVAFPRVSVPETETEHKAEAQGS